MTLHCNELEPVADIEYPSITSSVMTDYFVVAAMRGLSPNATNFDTFRLDDAIARMIRSINTTGGFVVKGWYKPSVTDEGAAQDVKKIQFCSVEPGQDLTPKQRALMYQ